MAQQKTPADKLQSARNLASQERIHGKSKLDEATSSYVQGKQLLNGFDEQFEDEFSQRYNTLSTEVAASLAQLETADNGVDADKIREAAARMLEARKPLRELNDQMRSFLYAHKMQATLVSVSDIVYELDQHQQLIEELQSYADSDETPAEQQRTAADAADSIAFITRLANDKASIEAETLSVNERFELQRQLFNNPVIEAAEELRWDLQRGERKRAETAVNEAMWEIYGLAVKIIGEFGESTEAAEAFSLRDQAVYYTGPTHEEYTGDDATDIIVKLRGVITDLKKLLPPDEEPGESEDKE